MYIISYIRKENEIPDNKEELMKLLRDIKYYQIKELTTQIEKNYLMLPSTTFNFILIILIPHY